MIDIIDKVLREEENRKICPSCSNAVPENKESCPGCGFDFDVETSKPENNLQGSTPEQGLNSD